jgi:dipeptidyl aminopeptidase/acylaminoacyl peptidase
MKLTKLFLIILIILASYFVYSRFSKKDKIIDIISQKNNIQKPVESFAFEEMTIPYLQNRKYESKLNDLEKLSSSSNYESFLTSYNSDNLKINALLTIPTGEVPAGGFPAIVFVHGYIPPESYRTTEKYTAYIDYLARNGFVVFKIDLRGHGSSEGEAGGAYYSSDYVIDTLNAYSALQNFEKVNSEKIGLWGHSMAGNVTFRSIAVKKDIPKVVIWGGAGFTYSDFLTLGIGDNSYRPPSTNTERARKRRELVEFYGQFDPNSWFWKQVTPINYLGGVTTELQLHHAVDDDVVNVEYSRNLDKILDETSIKHELFEYPNGGHNISGASFSKAMQETVDFFRN